MTGRRLTRLSTLNFQKFSTHYERQANKKSQRAWRRK